METGFSPHMGKALGACLILGCIAGVFYSSYRIEMGFTDIGIGLIEFVKRITAEWRFSAEWNLEWLEPALKKMVQIVAFVLLGFFVSAAFSWWEIVDRKRVWLIVFTAAAVSVADEGFQSLVLQGNFSGLDLIWDMAGVFVGYEILHFKEITNQE